VTQCQTYFTFFPNTLASDEAKVIFAYGCLEGKAALWFDPIMRDYQNNTPARRDDETARIFGSWTQFEQGLKDQFGLIDEERRAEQKIRTLKQVGSASAYASELKYYASVLDWEDDVLMAIYYDGLKEEVKDELCKEDRPDSLTDYVAMAVRIDNRQFEREREKQGSRRQYKPVYKKGMRFPKRSTQYGTHGGPMELDTIKDKGHERKKGECYNCGKEGHYARECRSPKKKRPFQPIQERQKPRNSLLNIVERDTFNMVNDVPKHQKKMVEPSEWIKIFGLHFVQDGKATAAQYMETYYGLKDERSGRAMVTAHAEAWIAKTLEGIKDPKTPQENVQPEAQEEKERMTTTQRSETPRTLSPAPDSDEEQLQIQLEQTGPAGTKTPVNAEEWRAEYETLLEGYGQQEAINRMTAERIVTDNSGRLLTDEEQSDWIAESILEGKHNVRPRKQFSRDTVQWGESDSDESCEFYYPEECKNEHCKEHRDEKNWILRKIQRNLGRHALTSLQLLSEVDPARMGKALLRVANMIGSTCDWNDASYCQNQWCAQHARAKVVGYHREQRKIEQEIVRMQKELQEGETSRSPEARHKPKQDTATETSDSEEEREKEMQHQEHQAKNKGRRL
jgi:hypothetical protein